MLIGAGDIGEITGPQLLVLVLSKGKLLNNNILILKTDFF